MAPILGERKRAPVLPDLYEASIAQLQQGLAEGDFTSVDLVKAYLARIDEVNLKGPTLRAVIETNPNVIAQAASLDAERRVSGPRSVLHGIPILLKDSIATDISAAMQTTAGSYALLNSVPPRAATTATKLHTAGALLLGKANLSEWANFRGTVPNGFSARGGQTTCAYAPRADPSGSSAGSGVAPSVGLCAAALGTETDGSIVSPASRNNVVGVKPTVGLTSRAGVVPISRHQDTVGPMARCVADAAAVLGVIAGRDPLDAFTLAAPERVPNYLEALDPDGLKGVRLGVPRVLQTEDENMMKAFDEAVEVIRSLGATVVDPADFPGGADREIASDATKDAEMLVLETDFKFDVEEYISGLVEVPTGVRNMTDLIAFNKTHAEQELIPPHYTSQWRFERAEKMEKNEAYYKALETCRDLGRARGIDAALQKHNIDALFLPTQGRPSRLAAIGGYPMVTVPLGFQPDTVTPTEADPVVATAPGIPFGISFIGTAFSEFKFIKYAYAFEQATQVRLKRRAYPAAIPKTQLADVMEHKGMSGKL